MMEITQQKVEEYAPNAAAAKNGRDLVSKKKFSNLQIDADGSVIWGQCAGSGKNPYYCSADYVESNNPVFRCNCPSRQFPCKHCLGLIYAYAIGQTFTVGEIPKDILEKRSKLEKRQEKKIQEKEERKKVAGDGEPAKPKKVNTTGFIKKADTQLAGIELASKILHNIVQTGLSSIDRKEVQNLQAQIKELGNYYINGIQTAFNDLLLELAEVTNDEYTAVIDQINYISALLKKSTDYITIRKEDPAGTPELNSAIEEQIGYVWKLSELEQYGLSERNAELVQLSFNSYDNPARREFVDEGAWINLKTGRIYKTKNYRPYRASKYIKEDNSVPGVALLEELYIYPGDLNPRIRWEAESKSEREITFDDLMCIQSYAADNYTEMIKSVKNVIKNPLMDKNPLALISIHKAYLNGDHLVVEDKTGNKLTLADLPGKSVDAETVLKLILPENPQGLTLLIMINNNVQTGLFTAQPLTLVTPDRLIKMLY